MMGRATGKCFEFVYQMAMVVITKNFRELLPFHIQIGFEIMDHGTKSHKARKTFWMKANLFEKMSFQCPFCCESSFFKFAERNVSFTPFNQLYGIIDIP